MSEEMPEFQEGETVAIDGRHYTVGGIDPSGEGVRAYYLDDQRDGTVRLEPDTRRGTFTLVRVAELQPDDVLGVESTEESADG